METGTRGQQGSSHIYARARRNLLNLSILLLIMSFQGVGMGQNPGPADKSRGQSQPAEMPFKLYNDNLIVVKGAVGTVSGVNLILDTGTTPSSVSKSLASRLKLHGNTEPLETLNGVIQTESFILPHVQVGALSADGVRVITQDLEFMEQGLGIPIGGILGLDVLRGHNFTIDYRRKKIFFGMVQEARNQVHFETQSPLLTVKASVEGQELRLIVDSGTSGLVIFRNRLKENAKALRSAQGTFIATVAGTPQAKFFRTLVTLGQDTGEHTVTIAEANLGVADGFDGLLGFTGMGFRRVSFDFDSGTLGWDLDASEPSHGHSSRVPVPWLGCGSGFKGDDCQVALGIVAQALHQLNPRLPGWRVVVVPVDQWRKMSAAFVAHNSVPAFSNLSMASTYLSAELIFSDRDTDMKFLALTRLTGIERLQWVLAHEYGHIICQTHEERKANHAGDYLLRGQIGTCN